MESQASWLSMLSILCHFHGLLWKCAFHKIIITARARYGNRSHLSEIACEFKKSTLQNYSSEFSKAASLLAKSIHPVIT